MTTIDETKRNMDNDDETRGGNQQRKRSRQEDDDPLNLTLGLPSYSSQIPPVMSWLPPSPSPFSPPPVMTWLPPSPSPFSPPPLTTWPPLPADLIMAHYSTFSYPYQTGSASTPIQLRVDSIPPKNKTTPEKRSRTSAVRRYRSSRSAGDQKSATIPPPFPWATNIRGKIHSQEYLESEEITTIVGDVQCTYCEKVYQVSYNLRERFEEVENIFKTWDMRERAPLMWRNPEPGTCEQCGREKAVKPVIAKKKSQINWLFLLLGQTLGFCTLEQLKNFCKHSKLHKTGAKDRVLYLTYLGLSKMLHPNHSTV